MSDIPRLGGQHAAYLSRQIHDAVDGRRPALGRTHGQRFAPFDFNDVQGIADYLSRIGWKGDPSASPASARDREKLPDAAVARTGAAFHVADEAHANRAESHEPENVAGQ